MRILYTLLLALMVMSPTNAFAKRVTLPTMFFDIPTGWIMTPLKANQLPRGSEGVIVKPSSKANYSITFAMMTKKQFQEKYTTPLKKVPKKYIIKGNMAFAGRDVPSIFWSETPKAAKYILEIPSKRGNSVYIMYINMLNGTQAQWDKWSREAEKMLRSLHRKR